MLLKRIVISIILLFAARETLGQHWEAIRIPEDSIQPLALKFVDSLTGYFYGVVPVSYADSLTRGRHLWYRTIDGGRAWYPIQFDSLFNGEYYEYNGTRYYHGMNARGAIHGNIYLNMISAFGNTVIINPGKKMTNLKQVLLVSTNKGITWYEQPESENIFAGLEFVASFADSYHIGSKDYLPVISYDFGKTFQFIEGDETYITATTDTNNSNGDTYRLKINLACSAPDRWTAVVIPSGDHDTIQNKAGLMTLLTTNSGDRWRFYRYFLPGDTSLWIRGLLQSIRGTSSIYFYTGSYYDRHSPFPFTLSKYYSGKSFIKETSQRTSYLYSSNYGATWEPETTYYKRAVTFAGAAPGDVWMTLWRRELTGQYPSAPGMYADVIVHTTDSGKTWTEDTTTLHSKEFIPLDGNIIYFTDSRHGWIAASNEFGTWIFRYVAPNKALQADELPDYGYNYRLYPNPADQSFTAHLAPWRKLQRIEIYDVLGRGYLCSYKLTEDNSAIVDCSNLNPGYYFVRMIARQGNADKIVTHPFAVQR